MITEAARLWDTDAFFESEQALEEELHMCGYIGPRAEAPRLTEEELNARLLTPQAKA